MPVVAGEKSRFSVLRIEDDEESEPEEPTVRQPIVPKKAPKRKNKKKNQNRPAADADDTLHLVQEETPEQKELNEALYHSQLEFDRKQREQAEQHRVDLEQAAKNSVTLRTQTTPPKEQASGTSQSNEDQGSEEPSQSDGKVGVLQEADDESSRIIHKGTGKVQPRERQLIGVYRDKLVQTVQQLEQITQQHDGAQAEAKKYKDRYKKVCELLKDAELKDKARVLVDLERARKMQHDLTEQVTELSGQLEQARSRIHELENQVRKSATT